VDDKTNEIPVAPQMLEALVLDGRVVTADAMHTQRETAKAIIGHQGDYVMLVKDNQPSLLEDIQFLFQDADQSAPRLSVAETVDYGHGRIEYRRLKASSELSDYIDWPGLQQVFELKRTVTQAKGGKSVSEIVFGITSLSAQQASPKCLLEYVRQYWHIENKSHWVRDVTFGEDYSPVRCGSIPQVMAALRNTVIGLMRWSGATNIAAATRRFAAQPSQALRLIGIGV
jgi:predicted transposase YbfD/YdcC